MKELREENGDLQWFSFAASRCRKNLLVFGGAGCYLLS
jgi:hypothetical protein